MGVAIENTSESNLRTSAQTTRNRDLIEAEISQAVKTFSP
jgi:hypothetical protein